MASGTSSPGATDRHGYAKSLEMAAGVFAGPGEMRALCRALDWAATPLGSVDSWSQSLRTTAGIVLAARNPMFLWWGPELVQLYNDAYRRSLGEGDRHPRALGARGREFWTDIWEAITPQIEQVMTTGEATWHEDQYLPIVRNGRLEDVWWTYGYSPVRDDDGRIGGTLVICQETTHRVFAQRESEQLLAKLKELLAESEQARTVLAARDVEHERLVSALESSADFIGLATPEGVGIHLNAAARRMTGIPKDRPSDSLHITDFFFPEDLSFVEETIFPAMRAGRWRGEVRFRHFVTGEAIPVLYDAFAAHDPVTGALIGYGTVTRDLTERDRLLAAEHAARTQAEAANRAKSDFLAVMSHELRTPLNAIGGYAELIQLGIHGPVTSAQLAALERIQRSQRHLMGLINEVLNHAKVDAGALHYDITDVPLGELLATCEALTAPQAQARALQLNFAGCPPELRVHADAEKVQQIVLNLLTNALKFTEPGGELTLLCSATADLVTVRVRDTGRGIDPAQHERIFQPFVQVDARLTRTLQGIGLGLAISRDLARGMGGDLTVESTLGAGSTFILTLPRAG